MHSDLGVLRVNYLVGVGWTTRFMENWESISQRKGTHRRRIKKHSGGGVRT